MTTIDPFDAIKKAHEQVVDDMKQIKEKERVAEREKIEDVFSRAEDQKAKQKAADEALDARAKEARVPEGIGDAGFTPKTGGPNDAVGDSGFTPNVGESSPVGDAGFTPKSDTGGTGNDLPDFFLDTVRGRTAPTAEARTAATDSGDASQQGLIGGLVNDAMRARAADAGTGASETSIADQIEQNLSDFHDNLGLGNPDTPSTDADTSTNAGRPKFGPFDPSEKNLSPSETNESSSMFSPSQDWDRADQLNNWGDSLSGEQWANPDGNDSTTNDDTAVRDDFARAEDGLWNQTNAQPDDGAMTDSAGSDDSWTDDT